MRGARVFAPLAALALVAGAVVCPDSHGARARLINGDFNLGEVGGVAFEWFFTGDGQAGVQDGAQVLADVPPDGAATVFQVVPLCTPGARYRLTCVTSQLVGTNASAWVGLGPKSDPLAEEVVWSQTASPGVLSVEVEAQDHNIVAYLSVANPSVDGEPGDLGRAIFDQARLELAEGVESPPSIEDTASPEERETAQQLYAAGLALLQLHQPAGATTLFSGLVEEIPEARPEAAMALVRMSEADHFNEMLACKHPKTERDTLLGVNHLRAVLQRYPDQTEACALARCKIGEYYLGMQCLDAAKDQLDQALQDYPGSEGAMWAKAAFINYHAWKGEWQEAEQIYNEIKAAHARGEASIMQLGWAEQHFVGQKVAGLSAGDNNQAYLDHLQDMWVRYRETVPELALYCKTSRYRWLTTHDEPERPYAIMAEMREAIEGAPGKLHLTGGIQNALAGKYIAHGWKEDHRAEAERLLREILESEDAEIHHEAARSTLRWLEGKTVWTPRTFQRGTNVLLNHDLSANHQGEYNEWKVYGNAPNWPLCDWWANCPVPAGAKPTMAWNSVNCGDGPRRMEAWLIQDGVLTDATAAFRAGVWVAAEGFLGGKIEDVTCEFRVRFFTPFREAVGEFTTGPVAPNGGPKGWQQLTLEGQSPEDGWRAEFGVYFVAAGNGQHAVAIAEPSLIFEEEGSHE